MADGDLVVCAVPRCCMVATLRVVGRSDAMGLQR